MAAVVSGTFWDLGFWDWELLEKHCYGVLVVGWMDIIGFG